MDRSVSPEERLLKLIRGRGKKESEKKSIAAVSAKKRIYFNLESLRPVAKLFQTIFLPFLNCKTLNILLVLLLIIFVSYSVITILPSPKGRIQKISESAEVKEEQTAGIQISQPKNYDYYYQQFSKRDIFNAPLSEKIADGSAAGPNLKEAINNFKLVGIILDNTPQAIIEDSRTKQTYFLNKGDNIDNDIEIKDILESKVILIYAGEELELEL